MEGNAVPVCDNSTEDQYAIVIRFVKENQLYERFITFVGVTIRTDAELVVETVIETLRSRNIGITQTRRQGFDSCSRISGRFADVQAEVKKTYPLYCTSRAPVMSAFLLLFVV